MSSARAGIVNVDPALTAAIVAQTTALNAVYKERSKKQNAIIAAETAITVAMKEVHKVEEQMLSYLSNASGALQNLYQIKRMTELVGKEIPRNIVAVKDATRTHSKGTVITAFVSDEIKDIKTEIGTFVPLVSKLVTSGSYETSNYDGTTTTQKINLLSAAERYYILNEVVQRLENINTDLWLLSWEIQTCGLNDLLFHLDPDTWYNVMSTVSIANDLINDYKSL